MNYSEKLKNPKWQKKRLEILERDNFTCQLCADTETELHVHHLKYTGEPWDAPSSELQTLCKYCHLVATKEPDLDLKSITRHPYTDPEDGFGLTCWGKNGSASLFSLSDNENDIRFIVSFQKNSKVIIDIYNSFQNE